MNYKIMIFALLIPCIVISNVDDTNTQIKKLIGLKNTKKFEKPLKPIINDHTQVSKIIRSTGSKNILQCFDKNRDAITKALIEISKKISFEAINKLTNETKIIDPSKKMSVISKTLNNIRSYLFPSIEERISKAIAEEQKATAEIQKLIAQQQAKYLDAKQEFKECLKNNTQKERNPLGIPCGCEEFAFKFAIYSSAAEMEDMINTFNQCYPQK